MTAYFAQMPADDFWPWAIFSSLGCIAGFFFAFRNLSRARIIEDIPTAKIRSAHQGYVELSGMATLMEGTPIIAPLTGSECCWYHFHVERRGHKNSWHTVEKGTSDALFLLQDDTDVCIIDPEGAEVTPTDRSIWYGHSIEPSDRNPQRQRLDTNGGVLSTGITLIRGNYRYTEERIYPGDHLYGIGLFKTLDDVDHLRNRNEMARALLREWKIDNAKLLERFDADRDGKIDIDEWEQARAAAIEQVAHEHKEQLKTQVLHTLSNTSSRRRPYLLSSLPQYSLVRRYRLFAGGSLAGFFVAGALATTMLTARFMG